MTAFGVVLATTGRNRRSQFLRCRRTEILGPALVTVEYDVAAQNPTMKVAAYRCAFSVSRKMPSVYTRWSPGTCFFLNSVGPDLWSGQSGKELVLAEPFLHPETERQATEVGRCGSGVWLEHRSMRGPKFRAQSSG